MADKKITDLTELTVLDTNDLFVVVDDPAGTPITKRITLGNILANTTLYTNSTVTFRQAINIGLVHNAAMTTANVVAAANFYVNTTAASVNTSHQYGITVSNMLGVAAANVIDTLATAKFTLDVSNAAALTVNTFGVIVAISNTGTRAAQPRAFIHVKDSISAAAPATDCALSTKYLLSANLSANIAVGNTLALLTNSAASITHKLRTVINGVEYFILLANTNT